jgi:hypothetical protein
MDKVVQEVASLPGVQGVRLMQPADLATISNIPRCGSDFLEGNAFGIVVEHIHYESEEGRTGENKITGSAFTFSSDGAVLENLQPVDSSTDTTREGSAESKKIFTMVERSFPNSYMIEDVKVHPDY